MYVDKVWKYYSLRLDSLFSVICFYAHCFDSIKPGSAMTSVLALMMPAIAIVGFALVVGGAVVSFISHDRDTRIRSTVIFPKPEATVLLIVARTRRAVSVGMTTFAQSILCPTLVMNAN